MDFAGTSRGASGVDWANTVAAEQIAATDAMLKMKREKVIALDFCCINNLPIVIINVKCNTASVVSGLNDGQRLASQ